ncbi:hypothetical protein BUALT_Bualt17G0005500 [Buddleja alternifolia]|uniref:Uncharacterized protein n=1 Tax=Buddleja alternifolia TaxID=168488 RepID=A0AAV6WCV2_9LAMI|nr:hypothetical protein BUALT_Bualt17G0005500 [Buddleja alternifolia]
MVQDKMSIAIMKEGQQVLGELPVEGNLQSANLEKHQLPAVSSSGQHKEQVDPSGAEYTMLENKEDSLDKSSESSVESKHVHHNMGSATDNAHNWTVKETSYSRMDENEQQKDGQSVFSYSLLSTFVSDFFAGQLPPYLQSNPIVPSHRDAQRPPFVNLDFHETASIPLVTRPTLPPSWFWEINLIPRISGILEIGMYWFFLAIVGVGFARGWN